MGGDSVAPFAEFCKEGRGVYVLARTSNEGAKDFQDLPVDGEPLYLKTAAKIVEWSYENPGVGAVVGATSIDELSRIAKFLAESGTEVPLLIPGVGAQGGSAKEVVNALKDAGNPLEIHRINSSSAINYAYEKAETTDYAKAAADALKKLNKEIGFR
jgi:orotidine-5'-phosphate decarboxylase